MANLRLKITVIVLGLLLLGFSSLEAKDQETKEGSRQGSVGSTNPIKDVKEADDKTTVVTDVGDNAVKVEDSKKDQTSEKGLREDLSDQTVSEENSAKDGHAKKTTKWKKDRKTEAKKDTTGSDVRESTSVTKDDEKPSNKASKGKARSAKDNTVAGSHAKKTTTTTSKEATKNGVKKETIGSDRKDASNVNEEKEKLPNIVFLYADDLGIGDVGCFGNTSLRTPNVDSICRRGAKLTQHLAAAPVCTPSRAAMLTGRYPIRSGMASPHDFLILITSASPAGLPPTEVSIAQVLKERGYTTGLIGKWHLGLDRTRGDRIHTPNNFGFDYFFGVPLSNFRNLGEDGGDQVLVLFPNLYRNVTGIVIAAILAALLLKKVVGKTAAILLLIISLAALSYALVMITKPHIFASLLMRNREVIEQPIRFERMTERLVKEGVRFLDDRQKDQKPFFLFMSWLQVHTNLHAGPPFKGGSTHGPYGDEVEEMDWSIGQILRALDHFGFTDNTIIYFSSDNGGHLEEVDGLRNMAGGYNGIYRGGKGQGGQDGAIRVPTAISWAGKIRPGSVIDEPTSQMDLLPTLASITGATVPQDRVIDGRDMSALLFEKETVSPHEILFHYCGNQIHSARYRPRTGAVTYKFHWHWPRYDEGTQLCAPFMCGCLGHHEPLPKPRLYDVTHDPSEVDELDLSQANHAQIVQILNKAKEEQERATKDIPSEMTMINMISRPWMNTCCNFPQCNCEDPDNALQYTLPFITK